MGAEKCRERIVDGPYDACGDPAAAGHGSKPRNGGRGRLALRVGAALLFCTALLLGGISTHPCCAQGSPDELFRQGRESLEKGDADSAVKLFSKLLEKMNPDDPQARLVRLARSKAYIAQGRLKVAWKEINRTLASDGTEGEAQATALHLRGCIHSRRNRNKAAFRDFTGAIKVVHDNMRLRSESFAHRGVIRTRLGEYDEAVSDFNQAIRLNPDSSYAYAGRGLANLRKNRIEKARGDARKALAMDPDGGAAKMANLVLTALSVSFSGPDRVSVPIRADGHLFVKVRFGPNGRPYRFLIDTGATNSLVSRDLLARISNETEVLRMGRGKVITADGAAHEVTRYRVRDVYLYNMPLGDIEVNVMEGLRRKAVHLLGARSLKNVAISMNPAQGKAELRLVEPR
jgi:tetratricopeptide (TPR) repeat protein